MSTLDHDMLEGVEQIAAYLNKSPRKTYYLCETKQIPAFKMGGKWHLRPSAFIKHVERREAEAVGAA